MYVCACVCVRAYVCMYVCVCVYIYIIINSVCAMNKTPLEGNGKSVRQGTAPNGYHSNYGTSSLEYNV